MIRCWRLDDEEQLRPMIRHCLEETSATGFELAPTTANVERLWRMGLGFAAAGDPTLVIVGDGELVGYTLWGGTAGDAWLRRRLCNGWGTYVKPAWRRKNVAATLRAHAIDIARARGYDAVVGTAFSAAALQSALHDGFKIVGQQVEFTL